MTTASAPPPFWHLGSSSFAALPSYSASQAATIFSATAEPPPSANAASASDDPAAIPRARLPAIERVSLRKQGISLCSRERSQGKINAEKRAEAQAAILASQAAEAALADIEQQLEEGLINPDGTPAPIKRKRPGPGRPPKSEVEARGPDYEAPKAKKEREKREAEEAKEAEKKAKKAAKKAASAPTGPYEANSLVEVSLRLGESFANWYEATLVEPGKGSKWKCALRRYNESGQVEPLLLQGRPAAELVQTAQLRPMPPSDAGWDPTVGEFCELFFEDGWWKVRVQENAGGGQWTVLYAPAQAVHTVPRQRLRPVFTWDVNTMAYAPIKGGRGGR